MSYRLLVISVGTAALVLLLAQSASAESSSLLYRPSNESIAVRISLVPPQASIQGKYRTLLRVLHLPEDLKPYGKFHEYGYCNCPQWRSYKGIPPGYWIYVYPKWYIWRDCVGTSPRMPPANK